jgi:hypothetical protein
MKAWSIPYAADAPGLLATDALLPSPAGASGFVTARDGHFYLGNTTTRVRFWGVNVCFGGCFPSHEQADATARRLARFGVNAVRFHHMDNAPFPRGIFADERLETLSPEALDRLDYFIAALKENGVYTNLNLHVSRWWSKSHGWPNAGKLPNYDKIVDLFNPELIAAQQQYARDLLGHVNAYTKLRYADEPAVAMVEINNEDALFTWGGDATIAELPEPYGGQLQALWNAWLREQYQTRERLAESWNRGVRTPGPNLLLGKWIAEQHEAARMRLTTDASELRVDVERTDDTDWHLQVIHPRLKLAKGTTYTLSGTAQATEPVDIELNVAQAHAPWNSLGLSRHVHLTAKPTHLRVSFTCGADEEDGRVTLIVGKKRATITFRDVQLCSGGEQGLREGEDPAKDTVVRRGAEGLNESATRAADWFEFLRSTEERYFTGMRQFLKDELSVKAPITGTIALGPLGAATQAEMDFVDAHYYWDHPRFPHRPWDRADWRINNTPMVDAPADSLARLCAYRVRGKPFTVTEYNNAAPNEWQAEGIPMLAVLAASQDWDAVFLFDYVGGNQFQPDSTRGYFDIEGNPLKMATLALGARLFLGGAVRPLEQQQVVNIDRDTMLRTAARYYSALPDFARDMAGVTAEACLARRIYLDFDAAAPAVTPAPQGARDPRLTWSSAGRATHTGRFHFNDSHAAVFVGFTGTDASPIELGPVTIQKIGSPFAVFMVVPVDPHKSLAESDRLLLAAVARGGNTGMQWDASRRTVSDHWGGTPSLIEPVRATLRLSPEMRLIPLDGSGARLKPLPGNSSHDVELGTGDATTWYEITQ